MYQFTTTNVINSPWALDYNGNRLVDAAGADIPKFKGNATSFWVAKVGDFKATSIVSATKRAFTAGRKEVAQLIVPTYTANNTVRLVVNLKLSGTTNSEYVNYSMDFLKPVIVEVLSTGNSTTDATALVKQLNALKNRFGHSYVKAVSAGALIVLTATEDTQKFESVTLGEVLPNLNSITTYDYVITAKGIVTIPGLMGFGDDAWMLRTVFVPTAENVRYFGISRNERPIIGGQYTEYVIRYSIEKDGTDGIVAGGKSITTHVFYVLNTVQAAFEVALLLAAPALATIAADTNPLVIGNILMTVAGGAKTLTGINTAVGTTWVSGTPATATVTSPGANSTVTPVAAGTTLITVTTAGKVGTFLLTVV